MNTDLWLKVSGCDESKILTDQIYCSVLMCGLCSRLLSLEAAVTTCCNKPFCCSCLEKYESACTMQDHFACPCSRNHNEHSWAELKDSSQQVKLNSLRTSQPLAFNILKLTKIACLHDSCTWTGCYSEFTTHLNGHQTKDVEPRLLNTSISKKNSHPYKKERHDSKSALGHEAKYSEKSTHEEILKIRKMRSYTIDSTHEPNFDSSFVSETHQGIAGVHDGSPTREELNRINDETNEAEIVAKAEKLKKHANAKFNAGNYLDARALYTQGINMMNGVKIVNNDDLQLLSDMYSNRAATFYRNKQFDECINDCEAAIRYDPTMEKSWIRKWRSLMVKGLFHNAHFVLEEAVDAFPESSRIRDEFNKSVKEMGRINLLQRCLETGNLIDAETILKESLNISTCENVSLLQCYADVLISDGDTNGASKYIDRALELNPMHVDFLELQGICHFYSGNMKEAVRTLTVSCKQNSSIKLKEALARVQHCYTLQSKAKIQTTHGRHDDADELLTALIRECEPLPPKSMLFSMLRVDRAHNSLLMHKHLDVLQDCKEVIDVNREFAPIWIIRSEVLFAIGKVNEARIELMHIRKTWGAGDSTIQAKYRKIDFEYRISQANNDVVDLQTSLDSGTCDTLPAVRFSDPLSRKTSHSKRVNRSSLSKKDMHCDASQVAKSTEQYPMASAAKCKSTETLDRWTSHSEREKSSDERPAMVNRNESLSQSSFHSCKNKLGDLAKASVATGRHLLQRKSSLNEGTSVATGRPSLQRKSSLNEGTSVATGRPSLQRKSSLNEGTSVATGRPSLQRKSSLNEGTSIATGRPSLQRKSSLNEGTSIATGRPSLQRKSSYNDSLNRSQSTLEEPTERRTRVQRRASIGASVIHSAGTSVATGKPSLQRKSSHNEGTSVPTGRHMLQRKSSHDDSLNRSLSTMEVPVERRTRVQRRASICASAIYSAGTLHHSSDEAPKHPRIRRSSGGVAEKESHPTSDNLRKPPERHKSSDNVLSQSNTSKLAEFRQLQRMKTLNGIFGCDWADHSATSTTNVTSDVAKRPATRRSQSDDLLDLRKALSNDYCGTAKK